MSAEIKLDEPERFSFPPLVKLGSLGAFAAGVVAFALSFIGGTDVAFGGWVIAAWFVVGFPLFAMFFLCINSLASAGWHITMKRVPEAMLAWFPVGLITMGVLCLSFLFTDHPLYEWSHPHDDGSMHSALLAEKSAWLNVPFFLVRTGVYFALWSLFAFALVRLSRKQDADGDVKHTYTAKKVSAIASIVLGLSVTFASIDYIKSIEPAWFSTMFGVYQFGGIVQSGFAMLILLLLLLQRLGYLRTAVNANHFHNLGIWLLASSTFWAYIWFCQFMLIWYTNIPEETAHFMARWDTPWFWVTFVINPLVNWGIPFLMLLPRPSKRNMSVLAGASILSLIGRFIDLWQFVMPRPHMNHETGIPEPTIMPWEVFWQIFIVIGVIGLFVFVTLKALEKAPLLAKKDPFFDESVHHHL